MTPAATAPVADSSAAWTRLFIVLALAVVGGFGLWSSVVVLPYVQAEFGVARGAASLPYTLTMIGFGIAGVVFGRFSDRSGIRVPSIVATLLMSLGYVLASRAPSLTTFALAQGLLIGAGSALTFGPLIAHISMWFERRRGIAVAIIASGNYLAGTIWPPIVQHFSATIGWRDTYFWIGVVCLVAMLPLALVLGGRMPASSGASTESRLRAPQSAAALGLSSRALQCLLIVAGVSCCVAMAMPQVHIVAYCGDLGYGPARGAQMLAVMFGFGTVSRLVFGLISDRIGGLRTLLLGASLQCVALFLFLPFDGLVSLFVISALFGLFQGGIVPSYAIIVREYFPPGEAGARIGTVVMATLVGMAIGGWASGQIFDFAGSYDAAFVHGIAWNLVCISIAAWLLRRQRGQPQAQPA